MRVAIVEKYPTKTDYSKYFDVDFDKLALVSANKSKVLVKDLELDVKSTVKDYDYIITVGAEPTKMVGKITSVTQYQGCLIDNKFLPLINPAMLAFKPAEEPRFKLAVQRINDVLCSKEVDDSNYEKVSVDTTEKLIDVLNKILKLQTPVSIDTETTALYPRDGYVLGVSIGWKEEDIYKGFYVDSINIDEESAGLMQKIINSKDIIMHNSKFDIKMLNYHFNLDFGFVHDTMLQHYVLDENNAHGLKPLAIKFTNLGDYDRDLESFKASYCRLNKIKQVDFTYDLIPFEILEKYASLDAIATLMLFDTFQPVIYKSKKLANVYEDLLIKGTEFLIWMEENGVPFDRELLESSSIELTKEILKTKEELLEMEEVIEVSNLYNTTFNINSVRHVRSLLYDFLRLTPVAKFTGTGEYSVSADVLEELGDKHPVAAKLLTVRRSLKILNTYLNKILVGLDTDGRLRTGFNLHTTTSGRLSSSGKLNLQQLPRDNKIVKKCIKARPEYKIVAMDLSTAEMFVAAALSNDKALQKIFKVKGDFHSSIAKMVYKLPCPVEEVKKLYPEIRQAAKAISFGILYGSGPAKVAEASGCTEEEARSYIKQYFDAFPKLEKWLQDNKEYIKQNAHIYSAFGRKRRLPNVKSTDSQVSSHEVRSGINFLVQSVASDINLLVGIDLYEWIVKSGKDIKIFALIHDAIVAEVPEDLIDEYVKKVGYFVEKDRGLNFDGQPIGYDIDIGDNYAFA